MSENNPYFKKLKRKWYNEKTVILIAAAIALLTGCAAEQPPPRRLSRTARAQRKIRFGVWQHDF